MPPAVLPEKLTRQDVTAARNDLGQFASLVGWPLETWQRDPLKLETRQTVLISPRQAGKSRSLSVLALWWAFRRPRQMVLVLSAGDVAAARLLRTMRQVAEHPLLGSSVIDETQHRVILSNGSEIRSVPASDSQIRGWTVDLLVVDDNSPDGTGRLADALAAKQPRAHALHRAGKLGLGTAYIAGFRWALERGYEAVMEMDCDFSHDPRTLPAFLAAAKLDKRTKESYLAKSRKSDQNKFPTVVLSPSPLAAMAGT